MKEALIDILNSGSFMVFLGTVGLWLLQKASKASPKFEALLVKYQGHLVDAVRWAEKNTKEGTKIDTALDYILEVIAKTENRNVTIDEKTALYGGLVNVHSMLEGAGKLTSKQPVPAATKEDMRKVIRDAKTTARNE